MKNEDRSFHAPRLFLAGAIVAAIAAGAMACSSSSSAPLGPVMVNPASLALTTGSPNQTFFASQTNFNGTFTAVSNDTTVATVAPTPPPDTFLVSAASSCGVPTTITVTGGGGMTATVNITNNSGCPCVRHHDMWEKRR